MKLLLLKCSKLKLKSRMELAAAVAMVIVEGAKRRKAPGWGRLTFFSRSDWWVYHAVADDVLCDTCARNFKDYMFNGLNLRDKFPYLIILDENTIIVNVHPNCRCYLTRLYEVKE